MSLTCGGKATAMAGVSAENGLSAGLHGGDSGALLSACW